jgi:peroxiredoxin
LYNTHPEWHPSTSWLWNPSRDVFDAYRGIVGLSTGVGQTYLIDLDGNIRYALQGKIHTKDTITNVIDELL